MASRVWTDLLRSVLSPLRGCARAARLSHGWRGGLRSAAPPGLNTGGTPVPQSHGSRRGLRSFAPPGLIALVILITSITRADVNFRNDVQPILTRAGCNAGACHGAAAGKN